MTKRVVIVGGSLAGWRTAQALRRGGSTDRITIVSAEEELPYDRPPLSKQVALGKWDVQKAMLTSSVEMKQLDIDYVASRPAQHLNVAASSVTLQDDRVLDYDALVIATGSSAILPQRWAGPRVMTLRTLEDGVRFSQELRSIRRLVIVGGGFIGCEVASAASALGVEVELIDGVDLPLAPVLTPDVARYVMHLHGVAGVHLHLGRTVSEVRQDTRGVEVVLDDAKVVAGDLVVVGIGARPETGWLLDSGLDISDGVTCDATLAAGQNIYAAGDVARFWHERQGAYVRLEHWTNASEQAQHVANILLGGEVTPYTPNPYFWSDLYGIKFQMAGWPEQTDEGRVFAGSFSEGRFLSLLRKDHLLSGVISGSWPRLFGHFRSMVQRECSFEEAVSEVETLLNS